MSRIFDSLRSVGQAMGKPAPTTEALQHDSTPIPFEIEYPEEAKVLAEICASKKGHLLNSHQAEQKVGRNHPCPCGSGKKYKKCCINKGET